MATLGTCTRASHFGLMLTARGELCFGNVSIVGYISKICSMQGKYVLSRSFFDSSSTSESKACAWLTQEKHSTRSDSLECEHVG